jgi:hypothetical protein
MSLLSTWKGKANYLQAILLLLDKNSPPSEVPIKFKISGSSFITAYWLCPLNYGKLEQALVKIRYHS